jgi:hypothetical protein
MKNQRALSRLSSWLESHKRELLKLLVFEESIERLELIDCTLRQSDEWMSEWKAKNPSLALWLSAPDESNRNAVVKLCLSTKDSHALTERNECRLKLSEIEGLANDGKSMKILLRSERSEYAYRLWEIPDPQPSGSEFPSAFVRRLKVLGKWIEVFGYPSRLERLVTRINLWLALGDDCHDYKAPFHNSEGHMGEGCFTDEYFDKVYAIGCLAELLLKTKSSDESELLSIVESNRNLYFSNLEDLKHEYFYRHDEPVEPRRSEKKLRCGSCCESYPWNGEYPYRCPKCEADKRERDNVTVSKSAEIKHVGATEPGKARRGRLPKGEQAILKAQFMATIREHPTMVDSPGVLASSLRMSESTVRRWINKEREKYARLSRRGDAE